MKKKKLVWAIYIIIIILVVCVCVMCIVKDNGKVVDNAGVEQTEQTDLPKGDDIPFVPSDDKNPYIYEIGESWTSASQIIAEFNEDFSSVRIYKNVEDSEEIMKSFFSGGDSPMTKHASTLKSAIIEEGVTNISSEAFYNCTNLTNVSIPNSLTSIGEGAFQGCTNLNSIKLPANMTEIGANAFADTAFFSDKNNWEGDVLYMSNYLIRAKESLAGKYEIKNGTSLIAAEAFSGCSNIAQSTGLTEVVFPDSIRYIGKTAFKNCHKLKEVTLPTGIIIVSDSLFVGCNHLETVTIPNTVTTIDKSAFFGCDIKTVNIPVSVTSIKKRAFGWNGNLFEPFTINYSGTKAQWQSIEFEEGWDEEAHSYVIRCTNGEIVVERD